MSPPLWRTIPSSSSVLSPSLALSQFLHTMDSLSKTHHPNVTCLWRDCVSIHDYSLHSLLMGRLCLHSCLFSTLFASVEIVSPFFFFLFTLCSCRGGRRQSCTLQISKAFKFAHLPIFKVPFSRLPTMFPALS